MISNILISLETFLLVLASSFAMYLPLRFLVKDKAIALRYAIPFSISIEIIIGYIFYCTSTVKYFPPAYLAIAILANILAYYKLRPLIIKKPSINLTILFSLLVALSAIIYTRYFDSFKFVGPGGNDAFNHLKFVKDLIQTGYLSNGYYAPGFHLFLMPIAKTIPLSSLYRFTGPAIGVVSALFFTLLIKDYLKNKVLLVFLLALLAFPIYNQFTLQTINFFSSSLSFIYFASLIFMLSDSSIKHRKPSLYLFLIFCISLAITVPYLFITLIPTSLILFFVVIIFKRNFEKGYPRYLFLIGLVLVLGFAISFGHVFIQSKLLKRYYGFPGIPIATSLYGLDEGRIANDELADKIQLPRFIRNSPFLRPMVGTGLDIVMIKKLRPVNSVLGLGAYLWIAFSLLLLGYAIRKKNSALVVIAVFSIFFGICTQTGFFEMSYYRGRSGWYLLLLSILGTVMFLDQIYSNKISRWALVGFVIISLTGFLSPPKFYRSYYDDEFRIVGLISREFPDKTISLVASNLQLKIVGENIETFGLDPKNLERENAFVVIEKETFHPNPVLAQTVASTDKNLVEFNKRFEDRKRILADSITQIKSSDNFKDFEEFFENDDFTIYSNIKKI